MPAAPTPPPADEKDWTWVITGHCDECGFDGPSFHRSELPARARTVMNSFASAVLAPGARERPTADIWSPLEYCCHVRDVCTRFEERVRRMQDEDDPLFPNWDQDETAVLERYWEQDPATVSAACRAAGEQMAQRWSSIREDQWQRPGRRSNGSRFTVDTIGTYFMHDLEHHLHDITR